MTPTPPAGTATLVRAQRLARVRLGLVLSVALLAAGIAGLGYLVSFEAISSFVVRIGALPENLRWCGPLLVDTFISLATLFFWCGWHCPGSGCPVAGTPTTPGC
jgi:hypothetical protein